MVSVILHNIRSSYNVGAIFRTADGAGVEKIYLTGYTPTPLDRFGREDAKLLKTSLGATATVPWEQVPSIEVVLKKLKQEGVQVVAVEQDVRSVPLSQFQPAEKIVYIFGNEVTGVESAVLSEADVIVEIEMKGKKESLNVSVTAGIVLFHPHNPQ